MKIQQRNRMLKLLIIFSTLSIIGYLLYKGLKRFKLFWEDCSDIDFSDLDTDTFDLEDSK